MRRTGYPLVLSWIKQTKRTIQSQPAVEVEVEVNKEPEFNQ
jgi:hypothetical protein